MENTPIWTKRFNDLVQTCHDELHRATKIGKKMLSATKANSSLHESYQRLGYLVVKAIEGGKLTWDDPEAKALIDKINTCKSDLETIEEEVNSIKFSSDSGPKKRRYTLTLQLLNRQQRHQFLL